MLEDPGLQTWSSLSILTQSLDNLNWSHCFKHQRYAKDSYLYVSCPDLHSELETCAALTYISQIWHSRMSSWSAPWASCCCSLLSWLVVTPYFLLFRPTTLVSVWCLASLTPQIGSTNKSHQFYTQNIPRKYDHSHCHIQGYVIRSCLNYCNHFFKLFVCFCSCSHIVTFLLSSQRAY